MDCLSHYESPVGTITLASDGEFLTGLWFDGQKYDGSAFFHRNSIEKALPIFSQAKNWLDIYFSGKDPCFTPPLKIVGSEFQKNVLEILSKIPFGRSTAYGKIAREIAEKSGKEFMSAQAVGGAVAHNPISLIVPCHRVLGSSGKLTGYAGGIERKKFLLALEGIPFKI